MRVALGIALLCLTAAAQDLEGARRQFAKELNSFAGLCGKQGLRGFRDRAYELLLRYEPDHKKARGTLKYRLNKKTQQWERKGDYARPADKPGVKREDATGRWRELTDAYVARVVPLITPLKGGARQHAIDELIAVAPDNHAARKLNGEVLQGETWVLAETPAARERRRAIEAAAAEIRKKTPSPEPHPIEAEDKRFGVAFPGAWKGRTWLGMGTVHDDEVKQTVRVADAAYPMLNMLFGGRLQPGSTIRLYLLSGGERAATIALTKHPAYTPADRRFALALDGSWVPGKLAFLTWNEAALQRTDIVGRQAIGLYLRQRFGITGTQGWAYEGIGLYANYLLCGTRLSTATIRTGYTRDRKAVQQQERGVKFSKVDWIALAHGLYSAAKPPDLRLLIAKDVNTLTADDLLVCYAMAAYLIECRPAAAAKFLTAYGKGATFDDALRTELGLDFPTFELRFRRWLGE